MDENEWLARHPTHRIACVSAATRLGLSVLRTPTATHIWLPEHNGAKLPDGFRAHRSAPLEPAPRGGRLESVPDLLAHVATCLPREEALIVWESALHRRLVTAWQLGRIRWRGPAVRAIAGAASPRSESLLETLVLHRLRGAGLDVEQQVRLLGHRVDFLVGARLVVQTDGYAHHSDAVQRGSDIEHDARLLLDGHPVIRLDFRDVVSDWDRAEARILRAVTVSS